MRLVVQHYGSHQRPVEAAAADDRLQAHVVLTLARASGMSRSACAARFIDLMGETAIGYVTAWRMDLAARLVREQALALSRVAERVGYGSEAAFNGTFRRAHGQPPGAFARQPSTFLNHVGVPLPG